MVQEGGARLGGGDDSGGRAGFGDEFLLREKREGLGIWVIVYGIEGRGRHDRGMVG